MAVAAHHLVVGLPVEPESFLAPEFCLADAHPHHAAVGTALAVEHSYLDIVEIGVFGRPEMGILNGGGKLRRTHQSCKAGGQVYTLADGLHHLAPAVLDDGLDDRAGRQFAVVAHLHVEEYVCTLLADVVVVKEYTAASHLVALKGIGEMEG